MGYKRDNCLIRKILRVDWSTMVLRVYKYLFMKLMNDILTVKYYGFKSSFSDFRSRSFVSRSTKLATSP